MHKKNLIKLLPAVAVIIAVAAAGFQQFARLQRADKDTSFKKCQNSSGI